MVAVESYEASAILTEGRGYLSAYDFAINPYVGCSFGCSYCYAAFFQGAERRRSWGDWLRIKRNAAEKLARARRDLRGRTAYLSSATDAYQPAERHLGLTRRIVEVLLERGARLAVQTRSPLALRDMDLFRRFAEGDLCVNVSVTTDDEAVRRRFEPRCPPIADRLEAVRRLSEAGVRTAVTMTPLLPVSDAAEFAERAASTGAARFVVERFTAGSGAFSAGTGADAIALAEADGWDLAAYSAARDALAARLPSLREEQAGFEPEWLLSDDRG